MGEEKNAASEYNRDARSLHNIGVLSEVYQKLVKEIVPYEEEGILRSSYMELDKAFRSIMKCEATNIMTE